MTQQTIFGQVLVTNHLYTGAGFISNGYVAVQLDHCEFDNTRMAARVQSFLSLTNKPPVARFVAELPPMGDLPHTLVFNPGAPGDLDVDRLIFINASFYELITDSPQHITYEIEAGQLSFRGHWQETESGLISMLAMYDVDGDLLGFCAGLYIDAYRDRVQAALKAAVGLEGV